MKKQTSYQKLKAENEKLKQDIYQLVMKEDTVDAMVIKERWRFKFSVIETILGSTRKTETPPYTSGGIMDRLINSRTMIIPSPHSKKKPFWIGLFEPFKE